ncbi:MAG: hypothetical protein AAGA46_00345 [Cyanobacteria bacterium P01_F01_bin.13]
MTLSTTARNNQVNAFGTTINTGAGANGTVEYGNSDMSAIYITWNLDGTNPLTAPATGVATFTGQPIAATGGTTGTATHYQLKNKDGGVDLGPLPLAANLSVVAGQSYDLSGTVTQPAS